MFRNHFLPGLTSIVVYSTFLGPKNISFISVKNDPTLATRDCAGVPTSSTFFDRISPAGDLTKLNELIQKIKMIAVMPREMKKE